MKLGKKEIFLLKLLITIYFSSQVKDQRQPSDNAFLSIQGYSNFYTILYYILV